MMSHTGHEWPSVGRSITGMMTKPEAIAEATGEAIGEAFGEASGGANCPIIMLIMCGHIRH